MSCIQNKKTGFTLAEVLITLTVIGVIAALTIPSLITNYQNQVYATKLENFFSTANAGFRKIMTDKGCSNIVCTGIMDNSSDNVMTNIQNTGVFNIVKKCNHGQTGCHDQMVYVLNGANAWIASTYYSMFVTSDGIIWGFATGSTLADCSYNVGSGGLNQSCNQLAIVDVNGDKPPNKFGRDIFRFYLLNDGRVVPTGMDNDTRFYPWSDSTHTGYCNPSASWANGEGCAARIAKEGWQMNY